MIAPASDIPMPLSADPQMVAANMGALDTDGGFSDRLDRAQKAGDGDALRTQLKQLVSETFLTPILKMARNDPFKSDLFHGGSGEDMFGQQLDQEIASRMADTMSFPFIEKAYDRFAGHAGKPASNGGLNIRA